MIRSLCLFALLLSSPLLAQSATPTEMAAAVVGEKPATDTSYDANDPVFRDVAKEFRCPTCTGLSVLESDAGFSVQIKEQVQEQMNLGKKKEDIVEYFVTRYGPWILREPPRQGFGFVGYAFPIALLVLGPILIYAFVWKRKALVDTHGVRPNEAILAEMHERLKQLKKGKA
jgi:cytochrome c-type biogenesis protein CcmH/NrfF